MAPPSRKRIALAVSLSAALVAIVEASSASPDRPRGVLAFHADPSGDSTLSTMNADGTHVRRVTTQIAGSPFSKWSPSGRSLAFISGSFGEGGLMLIRATGGTTRLVTKHKVRAFDFSVEIASRRVRNLSQHRTWDGDPAWSPDGRWIAFTRRAGHGEVAVMRSDGSQQTVLTGAVRGPLNDCCAVWRPGT
jgi:Tol biopolymer transport system component